MSDQEAEKATGNMHVLRAEFPTIHLAPWMSIHNRSKAASLAALRNISNVAEELDRRAWMDDHPEEPEPDDEFEVERVRGASGMFGFCIASLANHMHDIAPSEGGLGRRQGISVVAAQRSGQFTEPKDRSWLDRRLGRNKPEKQVSGADGK